MRDRGLKSIETIIQWQQRVTPKSDYHGLFHLGQDRGARLLRAGLQILDRRPLPPLRNRLEVDPKLLAQLRERSLRSLYCSSDDVRGRGAAVTNLSRSASFHACERITPANRGIKHLEVGLVLQPGRADPGEPELDGAAVVVARDAPDPQDGCSGRQAKLIGAGS